MSDQSMPRREKWLLGTLSVAAALVGMAACDPEADAQPATESTYTTVDGVDYPICTLEDCSDQPGQIGVWISPIDGQRWLSVGEYSLLIEVVK